MKQDTWLENVIKVTVVDTEGNMEEIKPATVVVWPTTYFVTAHLQAAVVDAVLVTKIV